MNCGRAIGCREEEEAVYGLVALPLLRVREGRLCRLLVEDEDGSVLLREKEEVGVWDLNCRRLRSGRDVWFVNEEVRGEDRDGEGDTSGEELKGRYVYCIEWRDMGVEGPDDIITGSWSKQVKGGAEGGRPIIRASRHGLMSVSRRYDSRLEHVIGVLKRCFRVCPFLHCHCRQANRADFDSYYLFEKLLWFCSELER